MIPEAFLIAALAAPPVFQTRPVDYHPVDSSIIRLLETGAQAAGYLRDYPTNRILVVRRDRMWLYPVRDRLYGVLHFAPFLDESFAFIIHRDPLPMRDRYFKMVFQVSRILKPGGFFIVRFDLMLEQLLEQNGFMRVPFSLNGMKFYQKIRIENKRVTGTSGRLAEAA